MNYLKILTLISGFLGGPGALAPQFHVFLTGQQMIFQIPNIKVIFYIMAVSVFILGVTLFVRIRQGPQNNHPGKFKNPFQNMNIIMAIVLMVFALFSFSYQILNFYFHPFPGLLFPTTPQGKKQPYKFYLVMY